MCKGGRVVRPPFLLHRGEAFYCTLGGLANRSDAKTNRPRLRAVEGVNKWIVWAYLLQRAPRLGSAVPLIGRNNMKKKALALLLAGAMAMSLAACGSSETADTSAAETPAATEETDAAESTEAAETTGDAAAADAADADAILDAEMQTPDEGVESPGREIREMLKNHDEPLEEWKD